MLCLALSVAVTVTSTLPVASWSNETPGFNLSSPFTTSKRLSETLKLWTSPASWSATDSLPTTAPAAFSDTCMLSSVSAVCASFTLPTLMVKVLVIWLPPLSVAVTLTLTVEPCS